MRGRISAGVRERNPSPPTDPVRFNKQGVAAVKVFGKLAKTPFQPRKLVAGVRVVGEPQDERDMGPPERVTDRRGHGVDVDVSALEDLRDANAADAAAVLEPPVSLGLVNVDDVLRNPIDVAKGDRRHPIEDRKAKSWIEASLVDRVNHHCEERLVT